MQDQNSEEIEAFECFRKYNAQHQAEANLESPSHPENPGRAGGELGGGCEAGWVRGLQCPGSRAAGRRASAGLCGEEGMCAAGGRITLPNSQLCF